ncbi:MAG: hypothetical protein RL204_506 [Bacteroidota bacterium]|jgi:hypothetical protein
MKRIFFLLSLVAIIVLSSLYGCRKEEEKELYSNHEFQGSNCNNGIQDGTETGVDCGGTCSACITVDLSCNQPNNTIKWNGTSTSVLSSNMEDGEVTIHPPSGGTLYLDFGSTNPENGIYVGTAASGGNGYVWMYYVPFGGSMYQSYYYTGTVQVTVSGSNINIQGCNLKMSNDSGSTYKLLNMNVNCF